MSTPTCCFAHRAMHTPVCVNRRCPAPDWSAARARQCSRLRAARSDPPWSLSFQVNERYLEWGHGEQALLLKAFCAKEMRCSIQEVLV